MRKVKSLIIVYFFVVAMVLIAATRPYGISPAQWRAITKQIHDECATDISDYPDTATYNSLRLYDTLFQFDDTSKSDSTWKYHKDDTLFQKTTVPIYLIDSLEVLWDNLSADAKNRTDSTVQDIPVEETSPSDNQILKYDAATSKLQWEADATGAGSCAWTSDSGEVWARLDTVEKRCDTLETEMAARAYIASLTSISNSTVTTINWSNETYDASSCFNLTTDAYKPDIAGYYRVDVHIEWADDDHNGVRFAYIYKNTTAQGEDRRDPGGVIGVANYAIEDVTHSFGDVIYCNGSTDSIQVKVQQSSGSSLNLEPDRTYVTITRDR